MTTGSDFGWRPDQPCPPWCIDGADHLDFRLRHRSDDFWHKGAVTRVQSEETDHNWNPLHVEVYLSQHVQVDERGHYTHPMQVALDGADLTPANARRLAAALIQLADQAAAGHPRDA